MSVRLRFALLYAGGFLVCGLLVVLIAFFQVSSTQEVGGARSAIVRHPFQEAVGPWPAIIAVVVGLTVLSLAFGWLLASRLLRPVRLMTATARDISASNLSRRLRLGRRDDEFTRLGETLNELLARLEGSFLAQRHFVANASHELRTPLTAERALLQVALADPGADNQTLRDACEQVLALGVQTERLIDALLTLATGERGIDRREPFDLAGLAAAVTQALGSAAVRHDVRLEAKLGPARTAGDPRLAESLITNLVDNALRYNVPGGCVDVWTRTRGGRAVVSVSNTGPDVPSSEVGRLFQPFRRLGNGRVQRSGGHGLGLAIVAAIADAHGATVTARARGGGGLEIVVAFPAPSEGALRCHSRGEPRE